MTTYATVVKTPVDEMVCCVDDGGALIGLLFLNGRSPEETVEEIGPVEWAEAPTAAARRQVEEYFGGQRKTFELRLNPRGSKFQRSVWDAVAEIPFGATESYGEVAERVGKPGAARAVGRANATNPVCLVVPCHRVVGSDGSLTGFGGGIQTKRRLLEFEGALLGHTGW